MRLTGKAWSARDHPLSFPFLGPESDYGKSCRLETNEKVKFDRTLNSWCSMTEIKTFLLCEILIDLKIHSNPKKLLRSLLEVKSGQNVSYFNRKGVLFFFLKIFRPQ